MDLGVPLAADELKISVITLVSGKFSLERLLYEIIGPTLNTFDILVHDGLFYFLIVLMCHLYV